MTFLALLGTAAAAAQQPDSSTVIRAVDAAVMARIESIAGYHRHRALCRLQKQRRDPPSGRNDRQNRLPRGDRQELYHPLPEWFIDHTEPGIGAILDAEKRINLPPTGRARGSPPPIMR